LPHDPDEFRSAGRRGFTAVRGDPRLAEARAAVPEGSSGVGKHFQSVRRKRRLQLLQKMRILKTFTA
jgi:hypothetical protein